MSDANLSSEELEFDAAFDAAPTKPAAKPKPAPQQETTDQQDQVAEQPGGEGDGQQEQQTKPEGEDALRAEIAALKRERDEALHKWRSDSNRQSVFARENNQLKERVAALTGEVSKLKDELAAARKPASGANSGGDSSDLLENAPELKAAVERRIQEALSESTRELRAQLDAANAKLAEVSQTAVEAAQRVEPLLSREEQREIEQVRSELDKLFPNWRRDLPEIARWVDDQEPQIKAMFPGRGLRDSSTVLKLFYADKGVAKSAGGGNTGSTGSTSRDRLKAAAGILPRSVSRPAVNNDDFDGAFEEFVSASKR